MPRKNKISTENYSSAEILAWICRDVLQTEVISPFNVRATSASAWSLQEDKLYQLKIRHKRFSTCEYISFALFIQKQIYWWYTEALPNSRWIFGRSFFNENDHFQLCLFSFNPSGWNDQFYGLFYTAKNGWAKRNAKRSFVSKYLDYWFLTRSFASRF